MKKSSPLARRRVLLVLATLLGVGCSASGGSESPASSRERATPFALAAPATSESCGLPEAPAATHLLYLGPTQAEYGDSLLLSARLTEASGLPLGGREVRFVLGTQEATATTDASGLANVRITPTPAPTSLLLTLRYAGDATTAPAQTTATVVITRADTVTRYEGPALLATGTPQQVRARLLDTDDQAPIAGRTLLFEAGGARATGTTDATGTATISLSWATQATGPATLRVTFAGDAFYAPSSDETLVTRYLPTAFVIWGGNTPGLTLGQRVNFWGHSWSGQVLGGSDDAQADFKGWASGLGAFALCQPDASLQGTPRLTQGCWGSKTGQSSPPARLPEYIGVLVSTAIAKQQGKVYGNIAALAVLRVEPEPVYGPVPGKPGWGTLVDVIDGGSAFPAPAQLVASQRQPGTVQPGQPFEVTVELSNPSSTRAERVNVSERFQGSLPSSGQQDAGALEPQANRRLTFAQTAPQVAPRGADEPEDVYLARLAAADGQQLSSTGQVRFSGALGPAPVPIDIFSSGFVQLPRLGLALSAPSCAGPCTTVSYVLAATNLGTGKATTATATLTLPDSSQRTVEFGVIEAQATVTRTVEWTVADPGPRSTDESVQDYLLRLQSLTQQRLTVSAELRWTDARSNAYGPLTRRVSPEPRLAIPLATAAAVPPVLPQQNFPVDFTVINAGNLLAEQVRLRFVDGASTPPLPAIEPGQSTPTRLESIAPAVAPKGAAEPDEAYRARLLSLNGSTFTLDYLLEWGTSCGGLLGPLPGSLRVQRMLPVLSLALDGPVEAQAGDTLTYTVTVRGMGSAEARGLVLRMALPSGTGQEVALPVSSLPPGATAQVPFRFTLPVDHAPGAVVAVASLRWSDAVGNDYGPLSASSRLEVRVSNLPPVVDAGPDQTLTLPASGALAGTVTDDGLPRGSVLRSRWVQVSGPSTVWFADASRTATQVTFSEPGTYVLRLMGSDGEYTGQDEMTVTVLPREGSGTTIPGATPSQGETLINVVRDGNQLRLDNTTRAFNFIWVAVSSKGTVVKLDTETGRVLGEYYTSPAGQPKDPSRTTVDKNGNVWATNRAGNSVVHIGLVENGQCEDRNNNGVIDTSTGQNDLRAWTNAGGANTHGGVTTAQDECILHYVRVKASGTRHVSVTEDNDVWVSGHGSSFQGYFDLIDGRTGVIKRRENGVGYGGYGGLIDKNGVIWSARNLLRWDTSKPLSGPSGGNWRGYNHDSYGLCIDSQGNVWNTALYGGAIRKFAPDGTLLGTYWHGYANAQGCVVDKNDDVWVAHVLWGSRTVGHLKNNGTFVGNVTVPSGPTGVAVDGKGRIWVTNHDSHNVSRINPLKGPIGADGRTPVGEVDFTSVNLGGTLYNYSDMTGSTLAGAPDNGTYTVAYDSGAAGSEWGRVAWTGRVCGDGALTVTAASSNDGASYSASVAARSGEDLGLPNGRHLKVNVAFRRSSKGESPALYDLSIGTANYVMPAQVNTAPRVDAGGHRTANYPNPVRLVGSACDDTLPSGGSLALQWSQVSGPGTVTFSAPGMEVTSATFSAPGTYVLRLTASDSALEGQAETTLTVLPANFPPGVRVDSPKSVQLPPGTVQLTATVEDDGLPAGSTVSTTWTKVSGPGTVSFENAAQVPTTATFSVAGTYVVRLTASDGQLSSSEDVLVQVGGTAAQNRPPEASAGPSLRLTLPVRTATLRGSATDDGMPAGSTLGFTWSQVSGPQGVTFGNNRSAETSVTFATQGTYLLRLTASDSQLSGWADVQVVVQSEPPANSPPQVSAGPDRLVALPPGVVTLSGRVLDDGRPEGGEMRVAWSQLNGPAPVSFTTPGQEETQATFTVPGTYTLLLWASDSESTESAAVRVEVSPDLVNAPPEVSASAPATVSLVEPAYLSGAVFDEGLPATGTLSVAWSQVSGPGTVTFLPVDRVYSRATFSEPGEYVLRLSGNDSELSAFADVTVSVVGGNEAPLVVAGGDLATQERTVTLSGSVSDDGLPLGSRLQITWSVVSGPGGVLFGDPTSALTTATFSTPGEYVLRLSASDSALSSSSDMRVRILTPQVPLAIPGWIGAPLNQSTLTAPIPIQLASNVTLVDGSVELWPADDPGAITVLAQNVSGGGGSTLATLDPTTLPNGSYVIHLSGTNSEGEHLDSGVLVTVAGELKPGRVRLSVTDLTVPVSGMPISIVRTYDSLERRLPLDFGHGWSLSVGSPRLELDQAKNVTLTQPNGQRVTFHFTPASYGGAFSFMYFPKYTAEPGVYGSLSGDGCPILVSSGGRFICFLADPEYTPSTYTYADPQGRVYTMGASGTLRSIRDLTGVTLTFGPDGITSSAGDLTVDIDRDPLGRVTAVTDPEGHPYRYTYDASGNLSRVALPDVATPLSYTYDATHLLLTALDARGNPEASTTYTADGRVASETNALGHTTRYTYDTASRTTWVTNPEGGTSTFRYTPSGRLLSLTDPLGRTTTHEYDANHNRVAEINALGESSRLTYDVNGHPSAMSDPLGHTTTITNNRYGTPTQITDAQGNTLVVDQTAQFMPAQVRDALGTLGAYTWDSHGSPLTRTDAEGWVTRFTYDAYGNELTQADPLGNTTTYTYDTLGRRTSKTDALGRVTRYTYDALGRLLATTDPQGGVTTHTYDANGNELSTTDPAGRRTAFTYDALNRLIEVLHPDGSTESSTYNFRGDKLTETDRAGRVTRYEYDRAGQLIRVTTALGTAEASTTTYGYNAAGRRIRETNALGQTTAFAHDAAGRLVSQTDALGNTTRFAYDTNGQRISMTDALGRVTRYTYDSRGRPASTLYPDGTTLQQRYDNAGRMVESIDQAQRLTLYHRDELGRLIGLTNPMGHTAAYAYDAVGNLSAITDANGRTTRHTYDMLDRMLSRIRPDGASEVFEYDMAGNRIAHQLADGRINRFHHDVMGQLIRAEYFDGRTVTFTYTPTGQRESVTDSRGTTRYAYDNQSRLVSVTQPDGQQLRYGYDVAGNRVSLTTPAGRQSYAYDALNRLVSVTDPRNQTTTFVYDAVGLRTRRNLPNGVTTTYSHDLLNRLQGIEHRRDGQPLASFSYTLDAVGRRLGMTEADGSSLQWRYDDADRLVEETHRGADGTLSQRSYTYDAVGNRLSMNVDGQTTLYRYNDLDQLLGAGTAQYHYDGRGNLVLMLDGNASTEFTYDAEDRLTGISLADGSVAQYGYDADGRRVSQTIGAETTGYLWDETTQHGDVVLETGAGGAPRASYLLGGNELISQERDGALSYYLHDAQGSVRALADAAGTVTDRYRYSAYGESRHTGTTVNPYQYTGQQLDERTGLYSLRARFYSPALGRFLSRDRAPMDPLNPAEHNRYGYGRANPITYSDPSGYYAAAPALPGLTLPTPAAPARPVARPKAGGAMGEYAMLITVVSLGVIAGATDIGRAATCMYLRATSAVLGAAKAGLPLMLLSLSRPDGERCVIPVFIYGGDAVAYHIEVAQFVRGREMIKELDRDNRSVVRARRSAATAPCLGISRLSSAWGVGPSECDEYPYASTLNGGAGASVMIVPAFDNNFHGRVALRSFYSGGWTNKWRQRLPDGTLFATVILFGNPPPNPSLIRPP